MSVRAATANDLPALEELYRAFEREVPPPPHASHDTERELAEVREIVGTGLAFLAEEDGAAAGFALARHMDGDVGALTDLYVAPDRRKEGVAAALAGAVVQELATRGVAHVQLEVGASNVGARAVYQRWGFADDRVVLVAPVQSLAERLTPGRHAESFASLHVQTDAIAEVERAVEAFAPRVGSEGSHVVGPRNGWVTVYDEAIESDPTVLVRFAREISSRLGVVVVTLSLELDKVVRMIALDRGGIVDEYLSVPEFYGRLAPGDVIGLAANPTVLARITGADPQRVREVARTATSPSELPEAHELLAALASVLGLEGAEHGYAGYDPGGVASAG